MSPKLALFFASFAAALASAAPFGENIRLRGSLDNSRLAFERTHKGHVAFLGGSITEMNGHRPMVMDWLRKRFPQTDFTFTDAGISSTTSVTGAFRLDRDVLSKGPVDLLFVEFAVNDDQDGHYDRAECIRGFEGIVRHARRANPNTDIVATFFVNEPMLAAYDAGRTPLTVEGHEAVAQRYGIPTVNLAHEVSEQIRAGSLTWKTYGGVHPAPAGNAIQARMVEELFRRAWAAPPSEPNPHPLPEPLDPLNYSTGRFIDLSKARFQKDWTLDIPDWKNLPGSKRDRFTSIPMLSATEPGAQLTLPFEGAAAAAYVSAGPDAGILEASVDGAPWRTIDLFHEYSRNLHYPRTVILAAGLTPGPHTLKLRIAAETHSAGHAVRIMQFAAN